MNTQQELMDVWAQLGLAPALLQGGALCSHSPIDGQVLAKVQANSVQQVDGLLARSQAAFRRWAQVPAPQRGELVRRFAQVLRQHKAPLGRLVSLEVGKITSEGLGEVQEMIDIADFAVGLSRQLHGLTIASERPEHRMMEQWHPLGPVGVITAFNFPVAVWAWNAALALVCGNSVVWKPSEKAPLCARAVQGLWERCCADYEAEQAPHAGRVPITQDLCLLLQGGSELGAALAADPRVALVSATGSTRMGRSVAPVVAQRFGRCLLELGGNNAVVVTETADLDLAVRGIVFGAVGTAGQRCTSTRRLLVHESQYEHLLQRLVKAYGSLRIGDPRQAGVLMGPLIDEAAQQAMARALQQAQAQGGTVVCGGERLGTEAVGSTAPSVSGTPSAEVPSGGVYVRPAIVNMPHQSAVVCEETFAPILYVMRWRTLEEAIALHNAVPQGLSSAMFTRDLIEAEIFLSASGSDCGIANVNLGTSGAEIGGAFGGDKDTGGGRESGSDAWRQYMRRATNTINRGRSLPLAQGVSFEV
jgi:aldehyde dehydrogenase (NAD+)